MNVSCDWRYDGGNGVWLSWLLDKNRNPTNDSHVTQDACICSQEDLEQWMPPILPFSIFILFIYFFFFA